jgi:hypothetical protein
VAPSGVPQEQKFLLPKTESLAVWSAATGAKEKVADHSGLDQRPLEPSSARKSPFQGEGATDYALEKKT